MAADAGSWLLVDDLWAAGDRRFLEELFKIGVGQDKKLKAFALKWLDDPRPFARTAVLAYVDDGCDRPHHRALVKKLFKTAEERGDDALMGRFMVALDRLARRNLQAMPRWNWSTRTTYESLELRRVPGVPARAHGAKSAGRFTWATRYYLQRRVFRYFRQIGRTQPERYRVAIQTAIARYRDPDLATPAQLLDAWSLVHVLYWAAPELHRTMKGVVLAPEALLRDAKPAPIYPEVWKSHTGDVVSLLLHAQSRTVRAFAQAILERDHEAGLRALPVTDLLRMLQSSSEEAQTVAVALLERATGLETLPLDHWLALLSVESPELLPRLTALVEKHVAPDRVDLVDAVRLACVQAAPVAELGLRWARTKPVRDLTLLTPLAEAPVPAVRAAATAWLAELLGGRPDAQPEHLRDLLDARFADVRAPAIEVMGAHDKYRESVTLWGALTESPHADVRDYLVRHLRARESSLPTESVERVWATTLLSIQRGSRTKPRALAQVAERCVAHPAQRASLLPLLKVGLRSVRPPERRAAIAVVARAALADPTLRAVFARELPELRLADEDHVCR